MSTRVHIDLDQGVVLLGPAVVPCGAAGPNGEVRVDGGCVLRPLAFAERTRLVWFAAAMQDAEVVLAESVLALATVEPAERRASDDVVALALAGAGEDAPSFDETLAAAAQATGLSADKLSTAPARAVDALARPADGGRWSCILFAQPAAEVDWAQMRAEFCGQLLCRLRAATGRHEEAVMAARRTRVRPEAPGAAAGGQVREEAIVRRPPTLLRATLEAPGVQTATLAKALTQPARSPSLKRVHMGEREAAPASDNQPPQLASFPRARFSLAAAPRRKMEPELASLVRQGGIAPALTEPAIERMTLSMELPRAIWPAEPVEPPLALSRAKWPSDPEPVRGISRPVETPPVPPIQNLPPLTDIADLIGEMLHHEADLRGID